MVHAAQPLHLQQLNRPLRLLLQESLSPSHCVPDTLPSTHVSVYSCALLLLCYFIVKSVPADLGFGGSPKNHYFLDDCTILDRFEQYVPGRPASQEGLSSSQYVWIHLQRICYSRLSLGNYFSPFG